MVIQEMNIDQIAEIFRKPVISKEGHWLKNRAHNDRESNADLADRHPKVYERKRSSLADHDAGSLTRMATNGPTVPDKENAHYDLMAGARRVVPSAPFFGWGM